MVEWDGGWSGTGQCYSLLISPPNFATENEGETRKRERERDRREGEGKWVARG